ncbi:hypothetical protein O9993_05955 [Vibrio lentus]|nr:hypothetical protein [Vibrio lentus]
MGTFYLRTSRVEPTNWLTSGEVVVFRLLPRQLYSRTRRVTPSSHYLGWMKTMSLISPDRT